MARKINRKGGQARTRRALGGSGVQRAMKNRGLRVVKGRGGKRIAGAKNG